MRRAYDYWQNQPGYYPSGGPSLSLGCAVARQQPKARPNPPRISAARTAAGMQCSQPQTTTKTQSCVRFRAQNRPQQSTIRPKTQSKLRFQSSNGLPRAHSESNLNKLTTQKAQKEQEAAQNQQTQFATTFVLHTSRSQRAEKTTNQAKSSLPGGKNNPAQLEPSLPKLLEIHLQRKAKQQTNNPTAPGPGKFMPKRNRHRNSPQPPSLSKTGPRPKVWQIISTSRGTSRQCFTQRCLDQQRPVLGDSCLQEKILEQARTPPTAPESSGRK